MLRRCVHQGPWDVRRAETSFLTKGMGAPTRANSLQVKRGHATTALHTLDIHAARFGGVGPTYGASCRTFMFGPLTSSPGSHLVVDRCADGVRTRLATASGRRHMISTGMFHVELRLRCILICMT